MTRTFNIWATLLDAWSRFLDAETTWEKYWGNSENPSKTLEEYQAECRQEFLDTANRVPFESDAADRGTALNECVDASINGGITVSRWIVNGKEYEFPTDMVYRIARLYSPMRQYQLRVEGTMMTDNGPVNLYGYVDELDLGVCHDIKTAGSYEFPKFKSHYQHLVYPYCLKQMGIAVLRFDYDIVVFGKNDTYETITESYTFGEVEHIRLRRVLNELTAWLLENESEIANDKLMGRDINLK